MKEYNGWHSSTFPQQVSLEFYRWLAGRSIYASTLVTYVPLLQPRSLSNYPTIIIMCITIFLKFTINSSSMEMSLVTICWHFTKLLKRSRHYVEIRQWQRCNHIWVTGTCYHVITVNAKITITLDTFLFICCYVLHEQWSIASIIVSLVNMHSTRTVTV